jgi:5-hydroxyisourate hydrolase
MSTISTHVLDTVLGKPAAGVALRLEKQEGGGWFEVTHGERAGMPAKEEVQDMSGQWIEVSRSETDADGRCRDLAIDLPAGVYRIVFDTGAYLRGLHRTSIYPEITITFTCAGEPHYHLPLLLSDNSYTTYRGS